MIPQTDLSWQEESWQSALKNLVNDANELCRLLEIDPSELELSDQAAKDFSLKVPRAFVSRMQIGNAKDPLLMQVLNRREELIQVPGFTADPLEENESNPLPGLIHKYKNRVLLTVSGACAIHCRYCFRRHFDYSENNPGSEGWLPVLDYLKANPQIDEVIYSGGDPLSAPDKALLKLTRKLKAIGTIKRLRVHTRFPVVIPQRITPESLEWLRIFPNTLVVLHINHANEIDIKLASAVSKLRSEGIIVFNQSVVLAGINDKLLDQLSLHRKCFEIGILPYYLHCLDPVAGASHFHIEEKQVLKLFNAMQDQLSGYMLPILARETPGQLSKSRL